MRITKSGHWHKRFAVKVRRGKCEKWTDWTDTDDYALVLNCKRQIIQLGWEVKVIDRVVVDNEQRVVPNTITEIENKYQENYDEKTQSTYKEN